MTQLTADDVVSALTVCCGEEPENPAEAVALVRQSQPSFAATLYSAWQAEGVDLDPGLTYELDLARGRVEFYRKVAAGLAGQAPTLVPLKGLEVAAQYPDGIVRAMNDLDFVAPTEEDMWHAVQLLLADGWDLHTATFIRLWRKIHVMVSLRRPHVSPYALPYGIEVASYVALGDLNGVRPVDRLPAEWAAPPVKNALMLIYERFEQRYRARDLVDATLMLGAATPAERATLAAAIERLGLQPEYAELAELVAGTSLPPLAVPVAARARPVIRARRLARGVGFLHRPVYGAARHLQRRSVSGKISRSQLRTWSGIQKRMPVGAALRGGLLAFGLPLEGVPGRGTVSVLVERGDLAWIDTPVGRFLLTIGDDVTEAAVEEASRPAPAAPATVPQSAAPPAVVPPGSPKSAPPKSPAPESAPAPAETAAADAAKPVGLSSG